MQEIIPILTPAQERRYVCETVLELHHDDLVIIYKYLCSLISSDSFSVHGSGCSINFDTVSDKIVHLIYKIVWEKRNE